MPSLTKTLNSSRIKIELERLLPCADIQVKTRFANATSIPDLSSVITESTSPSKHHNTTIVDARPVYYWLNSEGGDHLRDLFNATGDDSEYYIPVLAFVFTGEYQLGFTFKEDLAQPPSTSSIWGVALGDLVLVSHSSNDLIRGNFTELKQPNKGFGLTQTIIHEIGHMLGLVHPFRADETQNFVSSVMSYYPYEYKFSRFERDTLLRGHTDNLLMRTRLEIAGMKPNILNNGLLTSIQQQLGDAERHYANMSYRESLSISIETLKAARIARNIDSVLYVVIYALTTVFAAIVGVALVGLGLHLFPRLKPWKRPEKS